MKQKLFSILALLLMAATGAMAQGYTVTLKDGTEDADKWTIASGQSSVKGNVADGLTGLSEGAEVTVTYSGDRKVKSVTAVKKAPAYKLLSAATTSDYGMVVCTVGHLHDAKTAVPAGCTAVGILGKVTETGHGLIIALQNAKAQTWTTINNWESVTTYAGTTLKLLPDDDARTTNLTSYTTLGDVAVSNWCCAQKDDYEGIFTNLGSTQTTGYSYCSNVNAYITTGVGGTAMSGNYWSATPNTSFGWRFKDGSWGGEYTTGNYNVRPVLGF